MRLYLFVTAFMLSAAVAAQASDITYNINETVDGASAIGTITTDGTLGTLSESDISNFTLTVSDGGPGDSFDLAGGNLIFEGDDLSATGSGLYFDFGDSAIGGLVLADSTFDNYVCFSTQGAICDSHSGDDLSGGTQIEVDNVAFDGPVVGGVGEIATVVSATPEPSSFILLGTGLLGVAGVVRKRLG